MILLKGARISRRTVLRGAAGTMIALPLLEAVRDVTWGTGSAHAQATGAPRRFLVVATTDGSFPEHFWPVPPGADAEKQWAAQTNYENRIVTDPGGFRTGTTVLDTTDYQLSPICAELERHRDYISFVEGLDICDATVGHDGLNKMLAEWAGGGDPPSVPRGGWSDGRSVDQFIADIIGSDTKFESFQMSVRTSNPNYCTLAWNKQNEGLPPEPDPARVFERMFSDLSTPGENPELEAIRRERQSILDAAVDRVAKLKTKVSAADAQKLDQYLTAVRAVETRLQTGGSGAACSKPGVPAPLNPRSDDDMPGLVAAQRELLVMAFACDLTRVLTFQINSEGSDTHFPHIPELVGKDGFHGLAHAGQDYTIGFINRWYGSEIAKLLDMLKAVPEGSGTLLDSVFGFWSTTMAVGGTHTNPRVPLMLFGDQGGYFKKGHFYRYASDDRRSLCDLFVSILRSYGMDVNTFGNELQDFNHRPTEELRA